MNLEQTAMSLGAELRQRRWFGKVVVQVAERLATERTPTLALDRLAKNVGYGSLGDHWTEIPRQFASEHLTALLHKDMAYQQVLMPLDEATELATQALDLLGTAACLYSNQPASAGELGGWPLTEATFDSGVAVVTVRHVGLIWFEDED